MIEGNENNFNELIKEGMVLIDFYATWCGPCKLLSPVLEDFAKENEDIKIVKIDVDQNQDLAVQFGVMSVPTLILFNDGDKKSVKNGFLPKELLMRWIEENK